MFTPKIYPYGYGWMIRYQNEHRVACHSGGLPGYRSWIERWLDDSVFVVVLSNISAPVSVMAESLAELTLGMAYELPVRKAPVVLPPETLAEYDGLYESSKPGDYDFIIVNRGRVYLQSDDESEVILIAKARDHFYFRFDKTTTLEFTRDEDGRVTGYVVNWPGGRSSSRKLSEEEKAALKK